MGRCISPFTKRGESTPLPCGKCYECKMRRVSGWSFRLMKEAEVSSSAFFVTLTYDPETVPITKNGFMTLSKRDCQLFLKRLRKRTNKKVKYYLAGEYSPAPKNRPHYHIIIFNAEIEDIEIAWNLGHIHYGTVSEASVGYTLKYISKEGRIPLFARDDRQPEFSLMSKKMGAHYLTKAMRRWHKSDLLNRLYIPLKDGKKIAMPRYYRDKIYRKVEVEKIVIHMQNLETERWQSLSVEKQNLEMSQEYKVICENIRKYGTDTRKTSL